MPLCYPRPVTIRRGPLWHDTLRAYPFFLLQERRIFSWSYGYRVLFCPVSIDDRTQPSYEVAFGDDLRATLASFAKHTVELQHLSRHDRLSFLEHVCGEALLADGSDRVFETESAGPQTGEDSDISSAQPADHTPALKDSNGRGEGSEDGGNSSGDGHGRGGISGVVVEDEDGDVSVIHVHTDRVMDANSSFHNEKSMDEGWSRETPLHMAALKGDVAGVMAMIKVEQQEMKANKIPRESNVDEGDSDSDTQSGGQSLSYTRIANVRDRNGWSSLHVAASNEQLEVCETLVRLGGADVTAVTRDGNTVLHYLCKTRSFAAGGGDIYDYGRVLALLLKKGADPNARNNCGDTPLSRCCYPGCIHHVIAFVNACPGQLKINMQNNRGETCLHMAVRANQPEIVRILLDCGADMLIAGQEGTAIDVAEAYASTACFIALGEAEVNLKQRQQVQLQQQQTLNPDHAAHLHSDNCSVNGGASIRSVHEITPSEPPATQLSEEQFQQQPQQPHPSQLPPLPPLQIPSSPPTPPSADFRTFEDHLSRFRVYFPDIASTQALVAGFHCRMTLKNGTLASTPSAPAASAVAPSLATSSSAPHSSRGCLYITEACLCYYFNRFGNVIRQVLAVKDISALDKAYTALVIPNGIHVYMNDRRVFRFGHFSAREVAYELIECVWTQSNTVIVLPDPEPYIEEGHDAGTGGDTFRASGFTNLSESARSLGNGDLDSRSNTPSRSVGLMIASGRQASLTMSSSSMGSSFSSSSGFSYSRGNSPPPFSPPPSPPADGRRRATPLEPTSLNMTTSAPSAASGTLVSSSSSSSWTVVSPSSSPALSRSSSFLSSMNLESATTDAAVATSENPQLSTPGIFSLRDDSFTIIDDEYDGNNNGDDAAGDRSSNSGRPPPEGKTPASLVSAPATRTPETAATTTAAATATETATPNTNATATTVAASPVDPATTPAKHPPRPRTACDMYGFDLEPSLAASYAPFLQKYLHSYDESYMDWQAILPHMRRGAVEDEEDTDDADDHVAAADGAAVNGEVESDQPQPQQQRHRGLITATEIRQLPGLRPLLMAGIPFQLRGEVWYALSGAREKSRLCHPDYYQKLADESEVENDHATKVQIEKDVGRTYPNHPFFRKAEGKARLRRVLLAYSRRNPLIGYCQSMNFIAAMLLLFMPERGAFWTLATIAEDILPGYFSADMRGSRVDQLVFEDLLRQKAPELASLLGTDGDTQVPISALTIRWFMCVYLNTMPMETAFRIWDWMFFEGPRVLFIVACTILSNLKEHIIRVRDRHDVFDLVASYMKSLLDADAFIRTVTAAIHPPSSTSPTSASKQETPSKSETRRRSISFGPNGYSYTDAVGSTRMNTPTRRRTRNAGIAISTEDVQELRVKHFLRLKRDEQNISRRRLLLSVEQRTKLSREVVESLLELYVASSGPVDGEVLEEMLAGVSNRWTGQSISGDTLVLLSKALQQPLSLRYSTLGKFHQLEVEDQNRQQQDEQQVQATNARIAFADLIRTLHELGEGGDVERAMCCFQLARALSRKSSDSGDDEGGDELGDGDCDGDGDGDGDRDDNGALGDGDQRFMSCMRVHFLTLFDGLYGHNVHATALSAVSPRGVLDGDADLVTHNDIMWTHEDVLKYALGTSQVGKKHPLPA